MFRSFTVLQCSHHLIPKMKEPLRGIRFRTVPEILQAVDRSIRTINTTGAAKLYYQIKYYQIKSLKFQCLILNNGSE